MKKNTAKRRGRPRKGADEAKGVLLQVRLEPAEKQAFTEAAKLSGQVLSVWVRDRLRQAARRELEQSGWAVPFLASPAPGVE